VRGRQREIAAKRFSPPPGKRRRGPESRFGKIATEQTAIALFFSFTAEN